jgi:hypothetical protein
MNAAILEATSHLRTRSCFVKFGTKLVNLIFEITYAEERSYF